MPKETTGASSNQTAEKVLQVLEVLAHQSQPVKLIDLSRMLGMNTSTLYRFLTALQNTGYVMQQAETGKYALNLKICYLAGKVRESYSIASILHPIVDSASALFNESAHLSQEDNGMIVYMDNVVGASQILTTQHYIGKTAPIHCTGVGKLFLLEYTDQQLDRLIAEKGLPRYTQHTLTTKEALVRELEQVRSSGYAFDNEECEIGVRCVAVPIRDYTGRIVAGLSVSGPTSRLTDDCIQSKIQALLAMAEAASRSLGYV